MSGSHILAVYTFGQFLDRADSPKIKDFFDMEPAVLEVLEASPGYIARSGYPGGEGPDSWGPQVFPRFWKDNGDGWAPSALSLWSGVEEIAAATYHGLHGAAYRRGREWNIPAIDWPGYVLWWVTSDHRPDWQEATERLEYLHDNGPTAHAFTFKKVFDADGTQRKLDTQRMKELHQSGQQSGERPQNAQDK